MIPRAHSVRARSLALAASLLCCAGLLLACTSSGDGGRGSTEEFLGRGAQVTPDVATSLEYVDLTESSGDSTSTSIAVTAHRIFGVFNATFTVSYDPTALAFSGFDAAGTCMGSGSAVLPPQVDATSTPGDVVVGLSRNIANTTSGVDCGHLIELHFDVIGTGSSRLAFTGNREFQDPTGAPIPASWVGSDVETRL